jgi:NADH:ubiquinone oxidoreductase subunit 6 (subunit J)
MSDSGESTKTRWKNPVSICLMICAILFVALGIFIKAGTGNIVQHRLLPYFVDITRGVGEYMDKVFGVVVFAVQLGLIGLLVARSQSDGKKTRVALSLGGVLFCLAYFILISGAYILPRLH